MKLTKARLKQIIKEEFEDYPREEQGHPAVIKANDALYDAIIAVEELSNVIKQQPDSVSDMIRATISLTDIKSKTELLGRLNQDLLRIR